MITIDDIRNNWEIVSQKVANAAKNSGRSADDIKVIAVSKTQAPEVIADGLKAGISVFGENYAQEMSDKHFIISSINMNTKPEWHFIGHLQTNKVKYIAPFVKMIHSVDSVRLAEEISTQADKNNREIEILLQVNTSGEFSKSGCEPDELLALTEKILKIPRIIPLGLMTIGSFSDDMELVRTEFIKLRELLNNVREKFPEQTWKHLSMGMSGDYELAIAEGATMVRVGSAIFGLRN